MIFRRPRFLFSLPLLSALGVVFAPCGAGAQETDQSMSLNSEVVAVPAPGEVVIDGRTSDWDLSAGVWSYNAPDLIDDYSMWTHVMWDAKGVYYLARIHDVDPLKNATKGVDFARGWKGDSVQLRAIFDDQTKDEHQMHITVYYSTAEKKSYLIVQHGGLRDKPPYDATGPTRPDLAERFGETMDAAGGRIAMAAWDDGKGYDIEAFLPWSYVRLGGQPLKAGDEFVFGWEAMWAKPTRPGEEPDTGAAHRLADGVKHAKANRIFMFRARKDWGRVVLSDRGSLGVADEQRALQRRRLAAFQDLSTAGSIAINYTLPAGDAEREVTIAIDDAQGRRVRSLFGQYPRSGAKATDHWDGLDDAGQPVAPGRYTATILDHAPLQIELLSTVYNAGTPPWRTEDGDRRWGSDHGPVTAVATHRDGVVAAFAIPEAGMGLSSFRLGKGVEWSSKNSASDLVVTDDYLYTFEYNIWQKKFLVCRLERANGKLVPFVTAEGGQLVAREIALDWGASGGHALERLKSVSLAHGGGALWLSIPGDAIHKIDAKTGALLERRPDGGLASLRSRDGTLYGIFGDKTLWSLDANLAKERRLADLSALARPGRFGVALDKARVAVCDTETNQVFVYDLHAGASAADVATKPAFVIGKAKRGDDRPGGAFDRDDIMLPVAADFDAEGRVWVAEGTDSVHRTSVWTAAGAFADEFWGSVPYGATHGYNFEHDASRFIVKGIEFRLDYAIDPMHRKSAEVPLAYHPLLATTQGTIYRTKDKSGREHEFAFAAPGGNAQSALIVYRRDARGEFVPTAALFPPVDASIRKRPFPLIEQIEDSKESRGWVDRDGDTRVDADEIVSGVDHKRSYWTTGWVGPDLALFTPSLATYALQEIDARGVPIYDFKKPAPAPNPVKTVNRQGSTGTPIIDRAGNITDGITYHTRDGRQGSYPNRFGRHDAPAAQRGVLIAPFRTNGVVEDVPGVGSVTALQGDRGEWYLMTFDGLYISSLFQDIKGRLKMDETLIAGESFGGHFWRVSDGPMKGRVLIQSGAGAYHIYELKNLETLRRQMVAFEVSADEIARGAVLAAAAGKAAPTEGALVLSKVVALPSAAPAANLAREAALVTGQPFTLVEEPGNAARWFKVSLLADARELALVYQVADDTPWKNGADLFTHAFTGGDAVDLHLLSPGKGALRLLVAQVNGQAQAVLSVKKSAVKDNPQVYAVPNAPGNARSFDVVKVLRGARIDVKTTREGYTVLARVPLAELGLDAAALPATLKGLAGVIYSDRAGTNRTARVYWHDKATSMVNDVPTESDVLPARFGEITVKP